MKDLTLCELFTRYNRDKTQVSYRSMHEAVTSRYRAQFLYENEVIPTGDREERALKNKTRSNDVCDRCGAPIRVFPWPFERDRYLCKQCDAEMLTEYGEMFVLDSQDLLSNNYRTALNATPKWELIDRTERILRFFHSCI